MRFVLYLTADSFNILPLKPSFLPSTIHRVIPKMGILPYRHATSNVPSFSRRQGDGFSFPRYAHFNGVRKAPREREAKEIKGD